MLQIQRRIPFLDYSTIKLAPGATGWTSARRWTQDKGSSALCQCWFSFFSRRFSLCLPNFQEQVYSSSDCRFGCACLPNALFTHVSPKRHSMLHVSLCGLVT